MRLYILKKGNAPILSEKFQDGLLFGLRMPNAPMFHLKVCLPLLSNKKNHVTWPSVISQDVTRHVESLSSKVTVMMGQIRSRTVLPLPLSYLETDCHDGRTVMHAIESMVINWTHLIQKVLKEDSSELILQGGNPGPNAELHFWRTRTENIQNIYDQLQSSAIQKMMRILEIADSSYYPSFKALTEEVSHALLKARDVNLHLQQLQPLLLNVEKADFSSLFPSIPALFHLIFLVWTHCRWYRSPARIVVLLQELGNMLIKQASSYLCAEELLQGDAEETLEKLQILVKIFKAFKKNFNTYRERVRAWSAAGGRSACWDFPSALVLVRFDRFLARILLLEDMFSTILELQKLEKLVFGGLKGKMYTEQVSLLLSEFQQLCRSIAERQYDPLDLDSQDFEEDYACFKQEVTDYDRRLGNIVCLAYKDCSGLESVFKVSFISGELLTYSYIRKKGKAVLCKNMSPVSGALKWARMLRERIQTLWENFRSALDMSAEGADVELVQQQYEEMCSVLHGFEEEVYSGWCRTVDQVCQLNLDQPLIRRDLTTSLLSVNFNQEVMSAVIHCYYHCTDVYRLKEYSSIYHHNLYLHHFNTSAPLLEVQMELGGAEMVFRPSLDAHAGDSFYELVEGLLADVFKMSAQIRRVASHLDMQDYQDDMDDMLDLLDMRQEVMERVNDVISKVSKYQGTFERYTPLWLDDRAEFLRQFLLYGHPLTAEYVELYGEDALPETPPTTDQFREQIDHYEALYEEVSKLEDWRVFEGWFRLDIRPFKMSLLNTIKKWSWMFKEHLISYVTDSMAELQEFILRADGELRVPVRGGDYRAVVQVMGCLLAVRDRQVSTEQLFDPLKAVVSLLEQYGETLPDAIYTQLEELPERWSSIKKLAWTVKHEVAPLQNAEVAIIRRKYGEFELSQFEEKFRTEAPLQYISENPYPRLDQVHHFPFTIPLIYSVHLQSGECSYCSPFSSKYLFEVSCPDVRQLRLWRREISTLKQLWDLLLFAQSSIAAWSGTLWRGINVDQMNEMQTFDKDARGWDIFIRLDHELKDLITFLRAVTELQNPAMRDRHWMQLVGATGVVFTLTERTTLADLLALQLHLYEEEVLSTVARAVKEMTIEKLLGEISQMWKMMEFTYEEHFHTTTPLLKCDDELLEKLEEHQMQLQAMLQMKQVEFFHAQVLVLQTRLSRAECVLMLWLEVQRRWAHLESVFIGSDDIQHQLPVDALHFLSINTDFKDLMYKSAETNNVIEATNKPGLLETLKDLQMRLAVCEKALAKYLETKRMTFPRFYFISSTDLLDILSNRTQPKQVTPHLAKLFDSVADLHFSQEGTEAVGIFSGEREYLPLDTLCDCTGPVEVWLGRVEEVMRAGVRRQIAEAVGAYEERPRELWALERPAQAVLTASQIWWAADVELAFQRVTEGFDTALRDYSKKQTAQLTSLISMLTGELSPGDRQKIMTVCTLDVHARDVVSRLVDQKVSSAQAFTWLSQLRHCWDEDQKHCYAKICDAQFLYSYEYLGNKPRLVITPLTDRCYVTLTQSLHLNMGGAPAGPAGTGKTETTKDLGRALGVMVYVFNCSEQMDYKSIGNIFKGLCQTGAWGCFDEFNRIAVEVLSVVAVQVKTVQDALRHRKTRFVFLEEEISLKPSIGVFITMNPGYSGRTELPENLKALFRPCAMVVPDMELICEIMLMAEGFLNAKLLGRKFITLYNLCKELLSKQDHYDWGLRAVKSVLVVAGELRRGDKASPEDQVLMRALRDFNMPKMVMEDVPVFLGLVGDLFPGVEVQRQMDSDFEELVRQSALELKLQPEDPFILKVVQLEELLSVRHSVFVVGGAGTGKSQILRTLYRTYANRKQKPVWNDLNPKAVSTDQLFGFIHPATREWKDGLLSYFMREQASNPHPGPKWVVLDGDIDPMWIESLNTVMDDNKVLTLASNERIPLTASMRLLFEISHLRNSTPATVSRAGILYINLQDLSWNMYVNSWIDRRQRQTERAHLTILFDKYVSRCIEQIRNSFKTITLVPENSMVQTLCSLLDGLLTPENVPVDSPRDVYEMYFVFACIWAFGGATHQDQLRDYRAEFSQWWVKEMKSVKLPAHATVFDFYLDPQTRRFVPWAERVPGFQLEADALLQGVLVPTVETVRLQYFLRLLLDRGQPVMLVGGTGTGKSSLIRNLLDTLPDDFLSISAPLHYYTSSSSLQSEFEPQLKLPALRGSKVGPAPSGWVDGTLSPHHSYDTQTLRMKLIINTQYIACMNPQAGHYTINPRLQRHFSVLAMNSPSRETLSSIFSPILIQHLQNQSFSPSVASIGPALVQAAIALHNTASCHFLPTAKNFLHVFSLWDLSRLFQGLLFSRPECVKRGCELLQLWVHESSRVYSDRFTDPADQNLFYKLQTDAEPGLQEPVVYLHYGGGAAEPMYAPVLEWEELSSILNEALHSYNQLCSSMNLVLFQQAMLHVCRISRILACPGGHALLVGVGGSGKQSLTRLAAHFSNMDVFQPTVHRGYGLQELKVDLAGLCVKTGVKNLPTVLLLTDAQIPDDRFLNILSALISGEVPEVLSEEEVDGVVRGVKTEVRALGLLDTTENCWRFFKERVRQQLKVVLGVSPVGNSLRVRVQRFPALLSCTTVDWFHEWPQKALHSVSLHFLRELPAIEPTVQEPISLFMAHAHASARQAGERYRQSERRHYYSTPRSFLELLRLYGVLLGERNQLLQEKLDRLHSGLQKLKTTAVQVEELKAKLNSQEVDLNVKNGAAEALISKIGQQTERVSQKRRDADLEEQKVAAIQAEVTLRQRDCENDLAKAEPALEAATTALNTLNKVNLTELKTFPNPPKAVMNVLAAVMVLLAPRGRIPKERGWKAARAFMGKVDDFLQALVSYDKECIPDQCLTVVKQEYLSSPDFLPEHVLTKSYAAAGLCAWTINIVRYYEVYCEVAPKRQALSQANTELDSATAKLFSVRKKLDDLDGHLQNLTAQFERAAGEKLRCQEEVTHTSTTIQMANRLVGGLQSEKVRWSEAVLELEAQQGALCGDVLLAAAFVSYAGYFSQPYREQLLENSWRPFLRQLSPPVPLTEGLDPVLLLADQASVAAWHNQGLPADRLSVENATGRQYSVSLVCSAAVLCRYVELVEEALACGEAVLIENLEEKLDPVLEPLLNRTTRNSGRQQHQNPSSVRLILHTKLANPHFPPELQAQTTLINFTVTHTGLEEQLLGQVVSRERPDLENLKLELSVQQNVCRIELKELEDELLTRLSAAEGSFLKDAVLVEQLEHTKTTALHIHSKVVEARENELKINAARELYRPVAQRAALLYFIIKELHSINPLYQHSLQSFSAVFLRAIEDAEADEDVSARVRSLTQSLTYSVLQHINRGLFQRDRLTFLTHTTFQVLLMEGHIEVEELNLLLHLPAESSSGSPVSFLSAQAWGTIRVNTALSVLEAFWGLDRDVEGSAKRWRKLVESECPERERLPLDWKKKSSMQKLIILRAMRPDRMSYALRNFVEESLGCEYLDAGKVEFEKVFEESSSLSPIFFILSPGVNPLTEVETLGTNYSVSLVELNRGEWVKNRGRGHYGILDTLEMCSHEQEFKLLLFSLCYFHACVSERRKFGPQGWNCCYPFNTGDLSISTSVLYNCLEANSKVPWEDLCYLVGEIMYGGHITDEWDRRLCRTQLQELFNPKLFEGELFLCPGFPAPPDLDYAGYHRYVDETLPAENPSLYSLHPNAEIEFMTVTSDSLFRTLLELQPRDSALREESEQSVEEMVRDELEQLLEKLPEEYDLAELLAKTDRRSPYILVCVQECERMNLLISEMHISLMELDLALKGELSISPHMEALQTALFYGRVPEIWSRLTFPSTKSLAPWFSDVLVQCRELDTWTQDFVLPAVVWLSGFFNPQSFLTAIMQSIARKNNWPLDRMALCVDVTRKTKDDYGHPPREGAYVHGLYIDGARWDCSAGVLSEAVLKDLTPAMPVLYIRAVPADQLELKNTYECPVYQTKLRGPTLIWNFHLKTRHPPAKWVLAGVALLLSV
uniref:Dynein, axonemal, heavy chain 11 n=1 Tax=Astyanax mexicanus TaxID=7994 RepID=A0A8B9JBK1_ASTMX